ncbi:MAG: uroporphyrinogen-III synthase [Arachnia sp.]
MGGDSSTRTVGAGQPSAALSAGPSARTLSDRSRGGGGASDAVGEDEPDTPHLTGGVFALDGSRSLILSVSVSTPEAAGQWIAQELVIRGAGDICDISASRDSRLEELHDDAPETTQENIFRDIRQDVHAGGDLWPRGTQLRDARVFLPREEGALSAAIEAAGPSVFCEPLIQRRTVASTGTLEGADWVAVTSARTVATMTEIGWRIPEGARVAAVGRATAHALEAAGYTVDLVPDGPASAADLLRVFPGGTGRVAVPGSALSSPELVDGLLRKGWDAEALPIYTVDPVRRPSATLWDRWNAGEFDAVLVTSGSIARAINDLLGWPPATRVLAFGQPTAVVLAELGVPTAVVPSQDPEAVVASLTDLLTKGQA